MGNSFSFGSGDGGQAAIARAVTEENQQPISPDACRLPKWLRSVGPGPSPVPAAVQGRPCQVTSRSVSPALHRSGSSRPEAETPGSWMLMPETCGPQETKFRRPDILLFDEALDDPVSLDPPTPGIRSPVPGDECQSPPRDSMHIVATEYAEVCQTRISQLVAESAEPAAEQPNASCKRTATLGGQLLPDEELCSPSRKALDEILEAWEQRRVRVIKAPSSTVDQQVIPERLQRFTRPPLSP